MFGGHGYSGLGPLFPPAGGEILEPRRQTEDGGFLKVESTPVYIAEHLMKIRAEVQIEKKRYEDEMI